MPGHSGRPALNILIRDYTNTNILWMYIVLYLLSNYYYLLVSFKPSDIIKFQNQFELVVDLGLFR